MTKEILNMNVRDWRFGQGEPVPPEDAKTFKLKGKVDESTGQLYLDLVDDKGFGLSMVIEVNQGRPCAHCSNHDGSDNLLHMFGLEKGIVVTPDTDEEPVQADNDRFAYNTDSGLLYVGYDDEEDE